MTKKDMDSKIAIIGAGISGIKTANDLIGNGFTNVCVYEASGRIGGRIYTKYFESDGDLPLYRLEMGAQWIHGTHKNPVFEFSRKHGILTPNKCPVWEKFTRHETVIVTSSGENITKDLFKTLSSWYSEKLRECDAVYVNAATTNGSKLLTDPDKSVEEAILQDFPDFLSTVPENKHESYQQLINNKLLYETCISGCNSMKQVSLNSFGSYVEFGGPHSEFPDGYIEVINSLTKDIPDDCIKLNCPVKSIEYSTLNELDNCKHPIKIYLENGASVLYDHVIVTSSLNVLKESHKTLFKPVLPNAKQTAIDNLGMGTVDKIWLRFENLDFFPPNCRAMLFTQPSDVDYSIWTNRLFAVNVMNTPKKDMLFFWITGQGAEEMETLDDDEVINGCMKVLSAVLCNDKLPRPYQVIRSSWHSEKYIRGSYSYIPVGGSVEDIKQLAQPICDNILKPVVQFAGEATHPQYYSSTHGAMLSGEREAQLLIDYYTNSK